MAGKLYGAMMCHRCLILPSTANAWPSWRPRRRVAASLGQDEPGLSDTAVAPEGEEDPEPPASSDGVADEVAASATEQAEASPDDLENICQVKRVLELLQKNRDMTFGQVNEGRIPENRIALQLLAKEMTEWSDLEMEAPKKKSKPGKSVYAKATDTGIDPETAAKRLNIDWDSAADLDDEEEGDDEAEVPSAVRPLAPVVAELAVTLGVVDDADRLVLELLEHHGLQLGQHVYVLDIHPAVPVSFEPEHSEDIGEQRCSVMEAIADKVMLRHQIGPLRPAFWPEIPDALEDQTAQRVQIATLQSGVRPVGYEHHADGVNLQA
ncbi:hypothetical protein ABZP36_016275 [Zizania latifolia]